MRFDFFCECKDVWLAKFCEYFKLDIEKTRMYFENVNPDMLTPNVLAEEMNLDLNLYDSSDVEIVARHMTTSSDNADSIKEKGLMDLKSMLQCDTPLSSFLLEYGIKVNVDEKAIYIFGEQYPVLSYKEPCTYCYSNRDIKKCDDYSKCDLRKSIEILALKLYEYGATVEFFFNASIDEMKRYSTISRCPEIIQTLEKIRTKCNLKGCCPVNMCYEWMKTHTQCVIVEFSVKLSDMETYAPILYNNAFYDYEVCFRKCGYDYCDYIDRNIPQNVLDNLVFLKWFISIYFYNSVELGSLLPNQSVKSGELKAYVVQ